MPAQSKRPASVATSPSGRSRSRAERRHDETRSDEWVRGQVTSRH
jgi:hypothetical protein